MFYYQCVSFLDSLEGVLIPALNLSLLIRICISYIPVRVQYLKVITQVQGEAEDAGNNQDIVRMY